MVLYLLLNKTYYPVITQKQLTGAGNILLKKDKVSFKSISQYRQRYKANRNKTRVSFSPFLVFKDSNLIIDAYIRGLIIQMGKRIHGCKEIAAHDPRRIGRMKGAKT